MEIFGVGVTLITQMQLNEAWSKARGSIASGGGSNRALVLLKKSHCL